MAASPLIAIAVVRTAVNGERTSHQWTQEKQGPGCRLPRRGKEGFTDEYYDMAGPSCHGRLASRLSAPLFGRDLQLACETLA